MSDKGAAAAAKQNENPQDPVPRRNFRRDGAGFSGVRRNARGRNSHQGHQGGGGRLGWDLTGSSVEPRRQYFGYHPLSGPVAPRPTVSLWDDLDDDMTTPIADEKERTTSRNLFWEAAQVEIPKEPPLKFEPPETDEHLKEEEFRKKLRESRQLIRDDYGNIMFDCRISHSSGTICQFCDGRRGPWARPPRNGKIDPKFLEYQDSIINAHKRVPRDGIEANMKKLDIRDVDVDEPEDQVLKEGIPIATRSLLE